MIKIKIAIVFLMFFHSVFAYSQVINDCLKNLPKSVLTNQTRFFSSAELSQAAHFQACNSEESQITDIFSSTLCKEEATNSSKSLDMEATVKIFDGVFGSKNTDAARLKYCDDKNQFKFASWKSDSCSEFSQDKFTDDVIQKMSSLAAPGAMDVIKGCFAQKEIFCAITGAKNENPFITLFLRGHGDIKEWKINTVNGELNEKPSRVLGQGELQFVFVRSNTQSPSTFNANLQYKDNSGVKNFSCSISIPKQACKEAIYKQKVSKYCSFKEYRNGVGAVCGVKHYNRQTSSKCEASVYKLGRSAACGVELHKAGSAEVCGVLRYYQCHHDDCGRKWNNARKRCRTEACGVERYKTCRDSQFGVERYKQCRLPEFGTLEYKACEHSDHGVASYNKCAHESFGKVFDSCRSPEHGIESCQDKTDTNPKKRMSYEPGWFWVKATELD